MADQLGFEQTEARLEEKFAYKDLIYPSKGSKNKFD